MKAIIPNLIENSQIPLYIQLYEHIKSAILSKEIAFGEKLPSLRNLSTDLGVSVTTVDGRGIHLQQTSKRLLRCEFFESAIRYERCGAFRCVCDFF